MGLVDLGFRRYTDLRSARYSSVEAARGLAFKAPNLRPLPSIRR